MCLYTGGTYNDKKKKKTTRPKDNSPQDNSPQRQLALRQVAPHSHFIYKRGGDPTQPENYRPITILSCFGKLFTAILNSRLNSFIDHHDILNENQAGFRSGYSTTDHIFTLHILSEILKHNKKKLFLLLYRLQ